MSGFEIAGAVLASLPILIEAGKGLSPMLGKPMLWRFRAAFTKMLGCIEDELVAFRQTVRFLLQPLHLDAATEQSLLSTTTRSSLWKDSKLQSALEARIGTDDYGWFMAKLHLLDGIVLKLIAILPITDGKVSCPTRSLA
jgi:hypothetical protein